MILHHLKKALEEARRCKDLLCCIFYVLNN